MAQLLRSGWNALPDEGSARSLVVWRPRVVDSCRFRALAPRVHVRWIRGWCGRARGCSSAQSSSAALTGPPGGGSTTPEAMSAATPSSNRTSVRSISASSTSGALAAPAEGVPAPPVIAGRGHRLRLVLLGQLRVGAEHALFSCPPRRVPPPAAGPLPPLVRSRRSPCIPLVDACPPLHGAKYHPARIAPQGVLRSTSVRARG